MNEGIVQAYIRKTAEAHLQRRRATLDAIKTREQAEARQAQIRAAVAGIIGPFPERGELKPKTIKHLEREGHVVEMLTYESLPGMVVTANLYLPRTGAGPHPAVVCPVGHWDEGKVNGDYQRLARMLAQRGIAALVFDAAGQGERVQLYDVTLRRSWIGRWPPIEHSLIGNQLTLSGRHLANFMLWDTIRGLDLLAERPEIDGTRLGAAGAGSGGTLARMLCAVEPRLSAAVTAADNYAPDSMGGEDAEQNLFGLLARGFSFLDLYAAFAPKPLLLAYCGDDRRKHGDLAARNREELAPWYAHFDAAERIETMEAEGPRGFTRAIRARAASFFAQAFGLGGEGVRESTAPVEPPDALQCTETGQVSNSLNTADLVSHHFEIVRRLPPAVALPKDAADAKAQQQIFREQIGRYLDMPEPALKVSGEIESRSSDWGLAVEKGRLIVEDGIYLPYSFYTEAESSGEGRAARPTVLAVHERGLSAIACQGPWMMRLAAGGLNIMAIDVRGTGETRLEAPPNDGDPYHALFMGPEAQWARRALNTGLNLFGCRVFDVLKALEYLRGRWDVQGERLSLVGVGRGALWTLYAAALDGRVERTALLRGLSTYKCLVEHHRHNHHFSLFLPGVLQAFDLPHVAACVAPHRLTLLNAVNQRRERLSRKEVERAYALSAEIFKRLDAGAELDIRTTDSAPETLAALADALGARTKPEGWNDWPA